jgi:hypothetical protein
LSNRTAHVTQNEVNIMTSKVIFIRITLL